MSVLNFIALFGGLAFFLFGMSLLSSSLEKMSGGKLEKLLRKVTDNPFKGLAVGAVITIAIQSSSAMTVMLVGFVNSGIMELGQTVGVIFGSDIGTTLTAWILSLTGISDAGGNVFLSLLKPQNFSLIFAVIGVLLNMTSKKQKSKDLGNMLVGFAILMTGMTMMSNSMKPLADMPQFADAMTTFNNPILGVLIGVAITGIIQSSAASIGILQGLAIAAPGSITYGMAIPIVMGANIGTCMTALLSAIGVNRKAKRVACIHISIKVIGTVLWLVVFYGLDAILHFGFMGWSIDSVGIAMIHTIFNIATTIVLFPFQALLVRLAERLIKDSEEEQDLFLDERLMVTPSIALAEVSNSVLKMIKKARKGVHRVANILEGGFDEAVYQKIMKNESKIDNYEDHIGSYLMKLTTTQHLSEDDKKAATMHLQGIGEFERLADHASYLANASLEIQEKNIVFSEHAKLEIHNIMEASKEIADLAYEAYKTRDVATARKIEPLQNVVSVMVAAFKEYHVERLADGTCTAEAGFVFNDILFSCGRIADHAQNIAAIVLRVSDINLDSRKYMHDIKLHKTPETEVAYEGYYQKYMGTIDKPTLQYVEAPETEETEDDD